MDSKLKDILNNLITTIKFADYDELSDCFKRHLHYFKSEMPGLINSLDSEHYYRCMNDVRDIHKSVELLCKLSDFLDYVGVLQGTIMSIEE